jgi:excisionase family DNA binding protein
MRYARNLHIRGRGFSSSFAAFLQWKGPKIASHWKSIGKLSATIPGSLQDSRDRLLTLREAAEVLRLNQRTVRDYVQRGEIEGRIIGGRWRFRRADLDAFFENAPREWDFCWKGRRPGLDGGAAKKADSEE